MKKYILLLDLKNDPLLIDEYEKHHKNIPAAIKKVFWMLESLK